MRTALLRVGTIVAAALLAAATVTAPAHAEPATLSGTITSESTGEPLAACVTIYTGETFEWIASTCADGSGTWSVTDGIEAGVAYKVEVSGDGTHLGEWADDAPYYWDATAFTAPAVVDVTLAEGAILEGALTDVAGAAAPWAWVSIVGSEYLDYVASTSTDSAGNWSVAVPPGTYKVQFEVDNARSWAFGKTTAADADIVTATAGVPTRVDNQLPETTELTGTITADDTGAPIPTCVAVYTADTYDYASGGCADDTGHWTAPGLFEGASYKVQVYGQDSYVGEWANDAYSFDAATTFTAPGVVDVGLAVGGVLEGTLTDDGGSPVTWGNVDIFTSDLSSIVASTGTFDTGSWSAVVPAGDYKIQFGAFPGGSSWAFRKATGEEADVVTVTAGGTTRVDDVLGADLPTGTFTGVVTDEQTGEPLDGICVDAFGTNDGGAYAQSCSGSDGVYTLEAPAGDWLLRFIDESGQYVSEYSGDTTDRAAAEVFTLADDETITVDAALELGGTIIGKAVDAKTGLPIEGVCPLAYLGHDGDFLQNNGRTCSDASGAWTITGLPEGSFALHFEAGWRSTYAPTWAFKADNQAEADLVAVKAGESTKVRNVQLAPGGTVTGVITDQFGQPVEGAWVDIEGNFPGRAGPGEGRYSGQTDANGRYVVNGVPAGDYTPLVYSHDYAPEWSGDADHPSAATPIRVKALKESTFDAQLAPGARLTGEVVNADGSPLSEYVVLDVFTADGRLIGDMDASADTGAFMSSPLPAGEFVIRAGLVDSSVDVWFDAATSREDATVVTLSRGEQMEITFHLP